MKKTIIILLILLSYNAYSQSLSVFDIDASGFPTIKAKFFAFDKDGNQISNLSISDFEVKENGQPRNVTLVSCPAPKPPQALSSVLTIDISGSMKRGNMEMAKVAAKAWINTLNLGESECAVTSFNKMNYFNQDFTTDRQKLLDAIDGLYAGGGTSFDAGLILPEAGGLIAVDNGKHKKVIVFLTDGQSSGNESAIISKANEINATIYCVALNQSCPNVLRNVAEATGGLWFENVSSKEEAEDVYKRILMIAQNTDPCEIEWESEIACSAGITNVELVITNLGLDATTNYQSPNASIAKLEIEPISVRFLYAELGVAIDTIITVTARNADFNVTNITSSNSAFEITPTSFNLNKGQSKELTVSFLPIDSGYIYAKFEIENDVCPKKYYASGGWPGVRPTVKTIKLIHPNGAEVFVAGSDTIIRWEGILPDEPIKIEYSTNNGTDWITIAKTATGLSYEWHVPKTTSNQCLARVTAKSKYQGCDKPDVFLCNQVWMGCNLDVEFYHNGEPIRYCETVAEWQDAGIKKEGAWCYYDNDPDNGDIYGKLYNWYAVNDPRGLAPEGWHVPTDEEWKELEMCLGMSQSEADKIGYRGADEGSQLAGRSDLWYDGHLEFNANFGTSGFSALPGGYCYGNGAFDGICYLGNWCSSSENSEKDAWLRTISCNSTYGFRYRSNKAYGFSVRLVRD